MIICLSQSIVEEESHTFALIARGIGQAKFTLADLTHGFSKRAWFISCSVCILGSVYNVWLELRCDNLTLTPIRIAKKF